MCGGREGLVEGEVEAHGKQADVLLEGAGCPGGNLLVHKAGLGLEPGLGGCDRAFCSCAS